MKRFFRATLGLTFALVLWVAALSPLQTYPEDRFDWISSRMSFLNERGRDFDTLVVGPSYLLAGVHPLFFNEAAREKGTPLHAFKLTASAMSLPEADFLIRHIGDSSLSKLKLLILDVSFGSWELWPANSFVPRSLYWSDWQSLFLTARLTDWTRWNSINGVRTFIARFRHTLTRTLKIGAGREWLAEYFSPTFRQPLSKLQYTARSQATPLPEKVLAKQIADTQSSWLKPQKSLQECRAGLDRPQRAVLDYLESLSARLQKRDIKVLFVVSPIPQPWLCRIENESEMGPAIIQFNHPQKYPQFFESRHRRDVNHLNTQGAKLFSAELANRAVRLLSDSPQVAAQ